MEKKIARAIKLYPIYYGLQADLLFFVAIDTLFLVTVKHFTEAQIILSTTISAGVGILLRFLILWLVKKIGNTAMVRSGSVCLLLSAILLTVGSNFFVLTLGRCFRYVTYATNDVALTLSLENNLDKTGKPSDFIRCRTRGNTYYASITLVIALVATYVFNLNHYLPMICCIVCAFAGFVLSFFIGDYTNDNKIHVDSKKVKPSFHLESFAILAIVAYGLGYTAVMNGIADAKLFIQQDIMKQASIEMTATIVGAIYFLSRVARLFSNMIFVRLYNSLRLKTGIFLASVTVLAFGCMLLGIFISFLPIKIFVMGTGYVVMLFCCDPIRHYTQQMFILYAPKEQHQDLFTYMGLAYQICSLVNGAIFSVVLLRFTMNSVMLILVATAVMFVVLMCMLHRHLVRRR